MKDLAADVIFGMSDWLMGIFRVKAVDFCFTAVARIKKEIKSIHQPPQIYL